MSNEYRPTGLNSPGLHAESLPHSAPESYEAHRERRGAED